MRSIKRDLEEQRTALSSSIKSMGAERNADHGREIVKDPYGTASITHDDEITFAVADNRARQLAEVTQALEDINAGRYGICRECGEPIAKARLKVMPFATRCVACQARAEGLDRAA
jgi:RNA polymerase-binding protein DksA